MNDLRLILIGPPGSGKGTQAQYICKVCSVGHVSTGDLLRKNTQKGTELGKTAAEIMKMGELVPDELIHGMLAELYDRSGGEGVGFVLDGFPRAESQAQALEDYLSERAQGIHKVLLLELDDDAIVGRLIHRRTCPKCGKSYHLKASPPKNDGRCDEDDAELIWRPDDTEEVIRNRLSTYHAQTKPVADFYRERGLLVSIDAARPIEGVRQQIMTVLEGLGSSQLTLPDRLENLVGGKMEAPRSGAYIPSINPSTGKLLCEVPDSGADDLEEAVRAAKSAFPAWRDAGVAARAEILNRLADLLDQNLSTFIRAEVSDNGMTWGFASKVEVPRGAQNLRSFANAALDFCSPKAFERPHAKGYVRHQPVGIVATITPWNLPLLSLTWKIAPALASGNCVIAKPSEVTPVTAYLLSTLVEEAGFPPGVLNILHGTGPGIGSLMTQHKDIARLSFTGSTATGRIIGMACAQEFKKPPLLEMGGKNPSIVFADARLDEAADCVSRAAFANQGQVCLSGSRIYVEKSIYESFKEKLIERAAKFKPGDPLQPDTTHGATVSEPHMKKVLSCLDLARSEGAKVLCGGGREILPGDLADGFFVKATLLEGLGIETRTNQEEIFGPVATIMPFETEEEVVALANNSEYGLAASIWTEDPERATRVADAIDAGMPWINCWNLRVLETPFGGFKNSGNGHREGVPDAMEFFTEKKTVMMPT